MIKKDTDFHIRISAETLAKVRRFADSSYRTPSAIINLAIDNFLKTAGKDENRIQ